MSDDLKMSDNRYLEALKRIRKSIADGCPLMFCNSDTIGDKHNECSWGLCSDDPQHWPDPEDHLWPDQFVKNGRVAPKYLKVHQPCPMDRRMQAGNLDINGCFWTCRIFRSKKNPKPTREQALALYDEAILRIQTNVAVPVAVGGND